MADLEIKRDLDRWWGVNSQRRWASARARLALSVLALGAFEGGGWLIIAPWVTNWACWSIIGGVILLLVGWLFSRAANRSWRRLRRATTQVTGIIASKESYKGDGQIPDDYYITVGGAQYFYDFQVPKNAYKLLSQGDHVTVTYYSDTGKC